MVARNGPSWRVCGSSDHCMVETLTSHADRPPATPITTSVLRNGANCPCSQRRPADCGSCANVTNATPELRQGRAALGARMSMRGTLASSALDRTSPWRTPGRTYGVVSDARRWARAEAPLLLRPLHGRNPTTSAWSDCAKIGTREGDQALRPSVAAKKHQRPPSRAPKVARGDSERRGRGRGAHLGIRH